MRSGLVERAQRPGGRARSSGPLEAQPDQERVNENASPLVASQAVAVKEILTSGRQLEVLVGYAGAGKSFTVAQLAEVWESETGHRVMGLTVAERAPGACRRRHHSRRERREVARPPSEGRPPATEGP